VRVAFQPPANWRSSSDGGDWLCSVVVLRLGLLTNFEEYWSKKHVQRKPWRKRRKSQAAFPWFISMCWGVTRQIFTKGSPPSFSYSVYGIGLHTLLKRKFRMGLCWSTAWCLLRLCPQQVHLMARIGAPVALQTTSTYAYFGLQNRTGNSWSLSSKRKLNRTYQFQHCHSAISSTLLPRRVIGIGFKGRCLGNHLWSAPCVTRRPRIDKWWWARQVFSFSTLLSRTNVTMALDLTKVHRWN